MLVPLPPRSTRATTPPVGNPGAACSAAERRDGVRDQSGRHAARRQARLVAQGAAQGADDRRPPMRGHRDRDGRAAAHRPAIASRASTSTASPRCCYPSSATSGTGSPTRSTKPVSTRPGWLSAVFSPGTPTSGGGRRTVSAPHDASRAGGRRARRRGSSPRWTTRESHSCVPPLYSAAHHDSGLRLRITQDPPNGAKPLTPSPLTTSGCKGGFRTDHSASRAG